MSDTYSDYVRRRDEADRVAAEKIQQLEQAAAQLDADEMARSPLSALPVTAAPAHSSPSE